MLSNNITHDDIVSVTRMTIDLTDVPCASTTLLKHTRQRSVSMTVHAAACHMINYANRSIRNGRLPFLIRANGKPNDSSVPTGMKDVCKTGADFPDPNRRNAFYIKAFAFEVTGAGHISPAVALIHAAMT
jgi:hypothetical protein